MADRPLFRTRGVWTISAIGHSPGLPSGPSSRPASEIPSVATNEFIQRYAPNMQTVRANAFTRWAARILTSNTGEAQGFAVAMSPREGVLVEQALDNATFLVCQLSANDDGTLTMKATKCSQSEDGVRHFKPSDRLPGSGGETPYDLTPFYLAMLLHGPVGQGKEWRRVVRDLSRRFVSDRDEDAAFELYAMVDAVFNNASKEAFPVPGGQIPHFVNVDAVHISRSEVIGGTFHFVDVSEEANDENRADDMTFGTVKAQFQAYADTQKWSPEEEELIPTFPDDYPVLPEAVKIAKRYVRTRDEKRPMNNFLWRGITSYGKSTGVEQIAALLHVPLVRVTCSSDKETQDFLSQFVPCNDENVAEAQNLPTVEQILYDPDGSWETITGEEREGVTADECLAELLRRAGRAGDAPRFKHIESNYVKALAHGWICEVQEISAIRDPGVLKGLNEYDRPGAILPLANGDTVRRHHDAMVIYTDNVGYAASRPVDQSVIRRVAFAIDSYEMPEATVVARVKYNTGFDDDKLLEAMYITWRKIQQYCEEHEITEGCVSVTELEMWAACIKAEGGSSGVVYDTCRECVVAKATSRKQEQDEIVSACVDASLYNV